MSRLPTLAVIVGPTASGKSSLALRGALHFGGEIINCDSMQMVKRFDIGTAKPSPEERSLVAHHLFDFLGPDEFYSAGRYMIESREASREVASRGRIPFLVGGTGLYLRAALEGVFEGPGRSDSIRELLGHVGERRGDDYLHAVLTFLDPEAAHRIPPQDRLRTVRALEVTLASGRPISTLQRSRRALEGFSVFKAGLALAREELYERINLRVLQMFETGLVGEVETLLELGLSPRCKGFEAIGYRQVVDHLHGRCSLEEAVTLTQRHSRRYAKRQMTWFRKEQGIHWLETAGEAEATWQAYRERFERFLSEANTSPKGD